MGFWNATTRKLGVPDLTTTVLTLTITGLAADSSLAGGTNPQWRRRDASVLRMFAGAAVGGVILKRSVAAALCLWVSHRSHVLSRRSNGFLILVEEIHGAARRHPRAQRF